MRRVPERVARAGRAIEAGWRVPILVLPLPRVHRRASGEPSCFGDRGSAAGAVIGFALLFLALAAFVVDGGLSLAQRERAADIAEQAARYAAQDIDTDALYRGAQGAPIDPAGCEGRVRGFVTEAGLSARDVAASRCLSVSTGRVEVEVRLTYRPVLGSLFYSRPLVVRGRGVAENRVG